MKSDKKIRVIVEASTGFFDYYFAETRLNVLLQNTDPRDIEIICGEGDGYKTIGEFYAERYSLKLTVLPYKWHEGRLAPFNQNLAKADLATHCVLFWDGISRSTSHMREVAIVKGLVTRVFRYRPKPIPQVKDLHLEPA